MGFPEPIPELTGKKAIEFRERLKAFTLTGSQREFYRQAFMAFVQSSQEADSGV